MNRQLLFTIAFVTLTAILGFGQNRAIDGTMNNLSDPELGATGAAIHRITSIDFEDGYGSPGG